MAFRTVIVDTHSKLEYSLNYLVFRTPNETKRVLLDEIQTVIIQSTEVAVTSALLSELSKRKIKVIFCDEKRNPESELVPYYGAHNVSKRLTEQLSWSYDSKLRIWQRIVQEKILNQGRLLLEIGLLDKGKQIIEFAKQVEPGDESNREGHAAKVYFNVVFGEGFSRDSDHPINAYLNYGYTILLSQFSRSITAAGYLTQLGIHHKGDTNPFNFSCDLMEPFRPFVDRVAKRLTPEDDFKSLMVQLLADDVIIDGKKQTMANAISIYSQSVFSALTASDPSIIKFPENANA